jgi:DNA-binding NarL/FixJ family response regulator
MTRTDQKGRDPKSITVLIADDHRSFGEALEVALSREKDIVVVGVVVDGEEAVEASAATSPDVVLMDLVMPGMDGLEATRAIRNRNTDTHVIILSGTDDILSLGRAVQAGARGLMRKTEAVQDLAGAVRRVHRGDALHDDEELSTALSMLRRRRAVDGNIARRMERLTPRELQILQRMTDGQSASRIASELGMSPNTLRTHTQNVLTKLGVHSKLDAIVAAIRHGKVETVRLDDTDDLESEPA